MKPGVHHFALLFTAIGLSLVASVASADPGTVTVSTSTLPTLVMLALVLASYCARRFAPQGHFFHTAPGAFALSLTTTVCSVSASAIQAHGLNAQAIVQAVVGGVLSLLATSNPSVAPGTTPPMAMKKPQAGSVHVGLVVVLALVVLAACAGLQAWKTCELNKLPQVAQSVIPTIVVDLGGVDQSTAITQVENIGAGLLPDQISCIVQAIAADMAAKAATVKGEPAQLIAAVGRNAAAYLKKHPAVACSGKLPPGVMRQVELTLGYTLSSVSL